MISTIMVYLVKVSIGSIVLFLCYSTFFRKDTFYERNRLILLLSLILPIIIPMLDFSGLVKPDMDYTSTFSAAQTIAVSSQYIESGISSTIQKVSFVEILFYIYIIGLTLSILKILTGIYTVIKTIESCEKINVKDTQIFITDQNYPPFSFFRTIVIPNKVYKGGEYESIIFHEKAHIEQKHYIDLLLAELFLAFQWFNPVAWILRKSITENHEFLADKVVSARYNSSKNYQLSLLELSSGGKILPLAHNFNKRIIKKRINMMNKVKTKRIAKIKNILIIPATILLLATITAGSYVVITHSEKSPFTEISEQGIINHIKYIAKFPREVAIANYECIVYVQMKVNSNIIEEIQVFDSPDKLTAPIIDDVVILALEADDDVVKKTKTDDEYREMLFDEGRRIAKKVSKLDIAEWKGKSIEFALKLDYRLTPNTASILKPNKAYGSNNLSTFDITAIKEGKEPLYIINNKIVPLKEFRLYYDIESSNNTQRSAAVATEIFGEKARDGFVWKITKDKAINVSLGKYRSDHVKGKNYPLFLWNGRIQSIDQLDKMDQDRTPVTYFLEPEDAIKMFGDKGKYGAALLGYYFPRK